MQKLRASSIADLVRIADRLAAADVENPSRDTRV
jgi:hypothetical protein